VMWNLGNLASCETRVIEIVGRADAVGMSADCLSVSYNNLLCTAVKVTQPALAITKSAPAEVLICDPIPLVLEVKNTGTGVASNVKVTDQLPAGLTTTDGQQTVTASVGNLAPGESKRVTINAKAARTGSFQNTGNAAADGGLTANSNTTTTVVKQPVLAITCSSPERIFLGRDITYQFTVSNKGDAASRSTMLNVPVGGATFVSATDGGTSTGSGVSYNLGDLAPGANKTVSVTVRPTGIATIDLTGTAQGVCAAPVTTKCATRVEGIPAILVEVVDDPDPVMIGDQTTYTIRVTNQGSAPGTNIKVIAMLGAEQDFVAAAGTTPGTAAGKRVEFAPVASLAPKATATWTVRIRANAAADVRFKVDVNSDQFSRPIEETESTNQYK
jgi:uncharacterized repeat protein (TIGR01451 family)